MNSGWEIRLGRVGYGSGEVEGVRGLRGYGLVFMSCGLSIA